MRKLIPALAVFAALSPFARAEDKAPAAAAPDAAATVKVPEVDAAKKKTFLNAFGWMLASRSGLAQLDFTAEEIDEILAGAKQAATGQGEADLRKKMEPLEGEYMAYMQSRYSKAQEKEARRRGEQAAEEDAKGKAFIAAAKKADDSIVVEPSGLAYKIVTPGTGAKPKPENIVTVKYTGKLIDGTVFDATEKHPGAEPSEFALNNVIKGWTEGLQKVGKGGKLTLWIPASLGYGAEGSGQVIKPGSTLVFDVEVLDVKDAPKEEAAPVAVPAGK